MPEDPSEPFSRPATLGELKRSGWRSRSVREELRTNVLERLRSGVPVVSGVLGFEDTIVPQLEHALIAGHDIIFLGERGQAKSRIIRSLVELLDEWLPVVEGSEINDDPYHPVSRYARELVAELGEKTPIGYVHRSDRYGEKLATPDTSIADLIGEVDPIKVAEGRYLSDELTIHYGLVPRTNRGIFAINELPDLAERIQVGLLNVLEERDIQIRGHRVRLPLDVLLVASANPDDYTSRGRIITPLKDRFGAQIRTHYPVDAATEVAIVEQEARLPQLEGLKIVVPSFMADVLARVSQAARQHGRINQRSGVSVRVSIANYETVVAAACRRAMLLGEAEAVVRVSDLDAAVASTIGKIEVEAFEQNEDLEVVTNLIRTAVLAGFREHVNPERLGAIVQAFDAGSTAQVGPATPISVYEALFEEVPGLFEAACSLVGESASSAELASGAEFVLEGLYLSRRLHKDVLGAGATYSGK